MNHMAYPITDPRVRDILAEIDGGSVLDVGCVQHDGDMNHDKSIRLNPNWLHQHLYKHADHVLGVDIDRDGVNELRESGYNAVVGNAERLDIEGTYDYIVAGELIEHLDNPGRFLAAARKRLTKSGTLILTTPNPWCFARMKYLVSRDGVPEFPDHTHIHDEETLSHLLDRYGFESEIRFVGPKCEGITRRLYHMPFPQLERLGATQLLAIASVSRKHI